MAQPVQFRRELLQLSAPWWLPLCDALAAARVPHRRRVRKPKSAGRQQAVAEWLADARVTLPEQSVPEQSAYFPLLLFLP